MIKQLRVHKNRTNVVVVDLGFDVSSDVFTSEIRREMDWESDLLATWLVAFETDGSDGRLILTLDDVETGAITVSNGYMDLKRCIGGIDGEPVSVFAEPIQVAFKGTVTA